MSIVEIAAWVFVIIAALCLIVPLLRAIFGWLDDKAVERTNARDDEAIARLDASLTTSPTIKEIILLRQRQSSARQ